MSDWLTPPPPDDAALYRVRTKVQARIQRRQRTKYALLPLLAAVLLWPKNQPLETLALQMPVAPLAPEIHKVEPPPPAPKIHLARYKSAEKITLFTDDPNVVIILVNESGGSL